MDGWLWASMRWTDLLDIALMSFILYRALLILRGTRAIQSLVGLLALIAVYLLSDFLELLSIHWLLEKFFVYFVLAVIILFQQDIRRGLARAGGQLFFTPNRPQAEFTLPILEELVRASFAMASRRMGALVAIERSATLQEFTDPATALDAQVSQSLLLAIFHPTSPLHDGAIVLRKGRIAAAQVFLPLTQSKTVSRYMGTRHRAALGLTEETDALIVIVSEERGTVSLVEHGELRAMADPNELREALQRSLQQAATERPAKGEVA